MKHTAILSSLRSLYLFICIVILSIHVIVMTAAPSYAESAQPAQSSSTSTNSGSARTQPEQLDTGPPDEFHRGNPRSSLEGFLSYAAKGNFEKAAHYLDMRYLPRDMKNIPEKELARKLKIILDRALWLDIENISTDPSGNLKDGLPSYREQIGRIKTPKGTLDILLQRVPRKDGVKIWKFSNRTVGNIPLLYQQYGYRPFEEKLSGIFPVIHFLGWQLWQWCAWLILTLLAYPLIWIPTWLAASLIRRHTGNMAIKLSSFITGPVRILLWMFCGRMAVFFLMPSAEIKKLLNAGTLLIVALCWASIRVMDIIFNLWSIRLEKEGHESSTVLLKPLRTIIRISFVITALLVWLDNIGLQISALLAGLGVGGLAVALAAQGVLKTLLGTVMILADRPYNVGERIVVNGHDGEVEEIGLRSTKIRLLTGHQVSIPNDQIERTEIENIGRRPHIRRKQNVHLALDTLPENVEKAVQIIRELLDGHEGMHKKCPPRVYFDKFSRDSLNIVIFYWYHPPEYWDFLNFSQKINTAILKSLENEGIKLAPPSHRIALAEEGEGKGYAEKSKPVQHSHPVPDAPY